MKLGSYSNLAGTAFARLKPQWWEPPFLLGLVLGIFLLYISR